MRILFLSNFYPPYELGGWEQNCREIVLHLRERGHICYVLTSRYGVHSVNPSEKGVMRRLHLEADIHRYRPLAFFLQRPFQDKENKRVLKEVLDSFKPDVIFIWGMWNLSKQVAYWAEQWLPGQVAYAVANYWPIEPNMHEAYWQQPSRHKLIRTLMAPAKSLALRKLARRQEKYPLKLEQVACVSEYVRQKLLEANSLPHHARVIYNGIDPDPFRNASMNRILKTDEDLQLIYVGSILPHKGVHTAIEAIGLLQSRDEVNGLNLMIIGGGDYEYEKKLKKRIVELQLNDKVTFSGRLSRNRIPNLLAEADVFLFTSIWEEPIARSVMEAMATGLPVIGTPVGGQREMLEDHVNALVYTPNNAIELANCILQLKHQPSLRKRLARAGKSMVLERFTIDRMVDEMETWLEAIVQ
jgi:glycosyltransferase involved in cell wall biosynthesis